jgi:hypothetical protein
MGGSMSGAVIVLAAVAQAIKASGVIVQVAPSDFLTLLGKSERPLVVAAHGGFLSPKHQYLTSYKGLAFYARSDEAIPLPENVELIEARSIWMPG